MSNFLYTAPSVLTPDLARATAAAYGWRVLPHDNGGFFAQRGQAEMTVTFAEDGSFRHADVREGRSGFPLFLMEGAVLGELAARSAGSVRPDEETT